MTNTLAYKAAAKVIQDFEDRIRRFRAPDVAPQECVTIRRKPVVDVNFRLVNPLSLKSKEELSELSTPDLEIEFLNFVTDLADGGVKVDFFPAYGLAPTDSNRREFYLQAFEHIRAIFFSPRKDATNLGL